MTDHNRSTSLYSNSVCVSQSNVSFNVYHEETRMSNATKSFTVLNRALNLYGCGWVGVRVCSYSYILMKAQPV